MSRPDDPQLSCYAAATTGTRHFGLIGRVSMGKHRAPRRAGKRVQPTVACRPRILVVEDDPEAALFTVHVLTKRGQFEVIHTADPAEALRLAVAEHWDLLLTDLDLPGMTGIELLAALRQVAPALPVAVTSAHALDGTLASLLGHADEYLEKPVRVDKLIATATALIGQGGKPATDVGL
jgi:CheY-like chemotaxis protein